MDKADTHYYMLILLMCIYSILGSCNTSRIEDRLIELNSKIDRIELSVEANRK